MASLAFTRGILKTGISVQARFISSMAIQTALTGMGAGELKSGLAVVKMVALPALSGMADLAILARIEGFCNEPPMHIFMTVNTSLAKVPEDPLIFLKMTVNTRRSKVGAIQWEAALIMCFKSI